MEKQNDLNPTAQDQTTYEMPEIVEHGSIEALTQNSGSIGNDSETGSLLA